MAGLFATILGASPGSRSTVTWSPDDDRFYSADAGGRGTAAGKHITPDVAMQFSAFYAGVHLLATTMASLPLRMHKKDPRTGSTVEAPEHPLNDLLEYQPNSWQTAWDFKCMMMINLLLRGNAYAEIIPGARGFADRLEPLHPDRVTVSRGDDGGLLYTVTSFATGNATRVLLQDEVFHIRTANAPGLIGLGPIAYARQTVGLALATEEHGSRVFNSGARPSGIVTVPKTFSEEAFKRFKADWNSEYGGVTNSGKTPILEDGASFQAISLSANDTQFLATREHQISEICRWLNVPPVMLHHMTKTTSWGSGVEAILLSFVRTSVNPWIECWTSAIRRDLILVPALYEARFDTESFIRGDSKAQADFYSRLVLNGILTRNEARQVLGYNPLKGLDEPLTPSNTSTSDGQPGNGGDKSADPSALIGHNGGPALEAGETQELTEAPEENEE